jgi:hypothetical protein
MAYVADGKDAGHALVSKGRGPRPSADQVSPRSSLVRWTSVRTKPRSSRATPMSQPVAGCSRGRGAVGSAFLGSVSHHTTVPVLIIHDGEREAGNTAPESDG